MEQDFRGYNHLRCNNLNGSIGSMREIQDLWTPPKLCSWKNNSKKMRGIKVWTQLIHCPKNKQMWEVQFLISERKFCSKICPQTFHLWNWNKRARVVLCWIKWANGEQETKICKFQPGKQLGLKMVAVQDHLRWELRETIDFQEVMKLQSMLLEGKWMSEG